MVMISPRKKTVPPVTHHRALFGIRRVFRMEFFQERFVKIKSQISDHHAGKGNHARLRLAITARVDQSIYRQNHAQHPQSLDQAGKDHRPSEERLFQAARWALHDIRLICLAFEDNRAGRVDDQFQEEDMHRQQSQRPVEQHRDERHTGNRQVY